MFNPFRVVNPFGTRDPTDESVGYNQSSAADLEGLRILYTCGKERQDGFALETCRWKGAYEPWLQSDRTDYSVWGEYAELAKSGRLLLPYRNERPSRRFAELHTALLLQREGFICWGVHLFEYERKVVKGTGNTKDNTKEVRAKWPWPRWPTEIQETLNFKPRNPDIVAYSENRNEWRFCEVKRRGRLFILTK